MSQKLVFEVIALRERITKLEEDFRDLAGMKVQKPKPRKANGKKEPKGEERFAKSMEAYRGKDIQRVMDVGSGWYQFLDSDKQVIEGPKVRRNVAQQLLKGRSDRAVSTEELLAKVEFY